MIRAISSVLALRIVGIGLSLGWFMLLVRLLPMEQVGLYAAINAGWLLMRALGPLGSDQALMGLLPELLQVGDKAQAQRWQREGLGYLLRWQGLLLLAAVGVAAAAQQVGVVFLPLELVIICAIAALCYGINGQQVYVMLAAQRPLLANGWESIWLPLALAAAALVLNALGALTLAHLLIAQTIIMLGFCALGLWLVRRMLRPNSEQTAEPLSTQQRAFFTQRSRSLLATSAAIHLTMRLPMMLAPMLIGAAQTALLETALRFATLLGLVAFAAAQVVLPQISALCKQQKLAELQLLLYRSSWLIIAPTLMLYALLLLAGDWIIMLVAGAEYAAATHPMLLLGAAYVLAAASGPMQHIFTLSGLAALVAKVSLLELLVSVTLMLLLAPALGAMGIAAAIAFGMSLRNGLFHKLLRAKIGLHAGVLSRSGLRWMLAQLKARR